MFNLGYKQIVVNSDSVITASGATAGDTIEIEGFGTFPLVLVADVLDGFSADGVAAALGVYQLTGPASGLTIGDVYTVNLKVKGPRLLSEIYPRNWDTLVFQTAPLAAASAAGFLTALGNGTVSGDLALLGDIVSISTAGVVTLQAGYEGVELVGASFTDGDTETAVAFAETTAASEGVGTGKQLEAEVRNATFDNIDPYGVQFGGSTAVDVRALYTTVFFSQAPDLNGWEAHEMLGYGDANTSTTYGNLKFVVYLNEASVSAGTITSVKLLASGTAT